MVLSPSVSVRPERPEPSFIAFVVAVAESPENPAAASSNSASSLTETPALEVLYFDFIAKIRPVGPVIGWTPQMSYAIRFGIARRTRAIRIGFQLSALPVAAVPAPAALVGASMRPCSRMACSWFSRTAAVTAFL